MDLYPSPSQKLEIRLFGPIEARTTGGVQVRLPSRRAGWILALLALRNGKSIDRQTLAGLVWPDSSDAGALHNLRQTLALLRKSMGASGGLIEAVPPRSICLRVQPHIWIDVLAFEEATADGGIEALERAVDLYRASLFMGCDEPFASEARDERERTFLASVEQLAGNYNSRSEFRKAADILGRAMEIDPYRESVSRSLMSALADLGETANALEQYRRLRSGLRRDLNAEPDPETTRLYRSIRQSPSGEFKPVPTAALSDRQIPAPLTPLLGRQSEVKDLAALIKRCRLVTLTGVGGIGKTRLAISIADQNPELFLDGIRFIDLSQVRDGERIPNVMAAAFEVHEQSGRSLMGILEDRLTNLDILIILDNCEHVIEGTSAVLDRLLSAAPRLHAIATSRQSLGVVGEMVWRVPSLQTPEANSPRSRSRSDAAERANALRRSDSVRLFLDRSGMDTDSTTTDELEAIGSICRRLDGIPLAIELAAARTKVLSISEIEARIENRFALLSGGTGPLPRHRTLRAALEGSWDLLSESERTLLRQLCIFRGGWSMEAAEAVWTRAEIASALDLMAKLVDQSVVISTKAAFGTRFSMLESIRQYASEHLCASGEWQQAALAHRDFFLIWVEEAAKHLNGPDENLWFHRMEVEHENLRVALDWSRTNGDSVAALRIAIALGRFWDTHGHLSEGRAQFEQILALDTSAANPMLVAQARIYAGWTATVQRDCIAARDHYSKALGTLRVLRDEPGIAKVLNCLGSANFYAGDFATAKVQFDESLAIFRARGVKTGVATVLNNLGEMALSQGQHDQARDYLESSLEEAKGLDGGILEEVGLTLCNLALVELREDRGREALRNVLSAIRIFQQGSYFVVVPGALNHLAVIVSCLNDSGRAATLLGASEALSSWQGAPLSPLLAPERKSSAESAKATLGANAFDSHYARGMRMTMDEAIAFALTAESLLESITAK